MFTTATSPKTLPGFIATLRKDLDIAAMTNDELQHLFNLHFEAWDRYRWFFGTALGWRIYQHQLFETTNQQPDLQETNPHLAQTLEAELFRGAYYFDDIIVPSILFSVMLRTERLFYKLTGLSPHRPEHN